ncbi:hypothetical protein [Bradyrhizobium monzae]|uniref:hypothetical protein n=1 Tax=Bradyrhizobium sp. Oc8 TaxID=2876780 RepID=UPI001F3413DF|nr:hypothetical protein [Bradyrhizobium sp. Oc8]
MTRLMLTTDTSAAGAIQHAGLADLVIAIERRLVWGPLPSDAELDAFFAARTTQPPGVHWLADTPSWRLEEWGVKDRGLVELLSESDGLEEGPFALEMHNDSVRLAQYKQSRLLLTELGKAVLAGNADALRYNPIHRWWGGTELTNERLWRWDHEGRSLVAPG